MELSKWRPWWMANSWATTDFFLFAAMLGSLEKALPVDGKPDHRGRNCVVNICF